MKLSLRIPLILLLLAVQLYAGVFVYAAEGNKPAPNATQWEQLTSDKAFEYKNEQEGVKPVNDDADNAFLMVLGAIAAFFSSKTGIVLLWVALFLFAAWALYRIFFNNNIFIWAKKDKRFATTEVDVPEDLENTNWELQLQRAMQANDMRLAIRYSYMLLLQTLQQRGQIQYRPDKTNYEYYNELNEKHKPGFRALTRQYEYAWYGNFEVAEDNYRKYMDTFNQMKRAL